ncbi:uncharacterized protein BXZ73DRAFT_105794 [Epithele typhae]|uniref:uncharacterized protein n=1 Tax=Epithele typhae TaxID=378194 RepID=UPI0020086233|nr:uncharacterized protein BXZ73DRAFT_105794 [Epithele typhae]KAH9916601.1 hypothetical protein BXZ73DRAFT_105794 [Epithele typhae]
MPSIDSANVLGVVIPVGSREIPISQVLGPLLVGTLLNCFVYGIVFLHWIQYVLGPGRDRWPLRLLVHWCILVDSVHTGAMLWMLWQYSVANFANPDYISLVLWPLSACPVFAGPSPSTLHLPLARSLAPPSWHDEISAPRTADSARSVSMPIQQLFAWRIKRFTHSRLIHALIAALSFAAFAIGMTAGVLQLLETHLQNARTFVPHVATWLTLAALCDLLLTVILYTHLFKIKTGFRSTNTVIGRLMRSSIETTASSLLFIILYLVLFCVVPNTTFSAIFAMPLGRVYTVSLLSTLNSRSTLRDELYGISSTDGSAYDIGTRTLHFPTEVAVAVERRVESAQAEEVDFRRLRHAGRARNAELVRGAGSGDAKGGIGIGMEVGSRGSAAEVEWEEDAKLPERAL